MRNTAILTFAQSECNGNVVFIMPSLLLRGLSPVTQAACEMTVSACELARQANIMSVSRVW